MRLFAILLADGHLLQSDCSPWRMRDPETTSFETVGIACGKGWEGEALLPLTSLTRPRRAMLLTSYRLCLCLTRISVFVS
jgi:hypothetical protein